MARAALRQGLFSLAAAGLLLGCVEGAGPGAGTGQPGATTAGTAANRGGPKGDIEAPEVFQVTDSALWDGRPSLGGIWVASPDAVNPERVLMFNPATGKTVQGALFRRERENPGPRLQISSDAAEALGMLAGQPAELRVTALRRAEPEPAPVAAAPEAAAADAPKADAAKADAPTADTPKADTDAAATAAAATAALKATAPADGATAAASPTEDPAATTEPPKRKTWKERRAEAKAAREAKKAAAAAAEAAAAGAADAGGEVAATADAAAVATVETAPLDARSPEVADAAAAATTTEKPKTRRQKKAEEEAAAAAAAATAAAAEAAPAATPGGREIQVASFSKEENANRAVEALAKIGVTGQARKSERGGKVVWGVVTLGDAEMLKKIKAAGFADAYFLT
jgi:rare lipoprotein A